ncbi:MAG: hypothetical protein GKR95_22765 [Gammaproteobacteria bacterium]|nr:hypothetical protein [Gammaproteobacteria bacterium]
MRRYKLLITSRDDLVFSERAATLGSHGSLDYIPGAALLGWCASRLYSNMEKHQGYEVFHSGKVRFGNGFLVHPGSGEMGIPMPLCMYQRKGDGEDGLAQNYITEERWPKGNQVKPIKDGYLFKSTSMGNYERLVPRMTMRMKTAINFSTGRAEQGQLFGYQGIEAGQRFESWIEIDDDVETPEIADRIKSCFDSEILLGRSRSAQYGRACVEWEDHPDSPDSMEQNSQTIGDECRLLLVADLAISSSGMDGRLELWPGVSIDPVRSFVNYRRYSPYNAKRRCYDLERLVMTKGSVLTVKIGSAVNRTVFLKRLCRGLGFYIESGLGRVILNPSILNETQLDFSSEPTPVNRRTESMHTGRPDHELISWLENQSNSAEGKSMDIVLAEKAVKKLSNRYKEARDYAGKPDGHRVGPGPSQWGRVKEAGINYRTDRSQLFRVLFEDDNCICGKDDPDWSAITFEGNEMISFSEWLRRRLDSKEINCHGDVVTIIGRRAAKVAQKQERKAERNQ